jgi:hypothetical protein
MLPVYIEYVRLPGGHLVGGSPVQVGQLSESGPDHLQFMRVTGTGDMGKQICPNSLPTMLVIPDNVALRGVFWGIHAGSNCECPPATSFLRVEFGANILTVVLCLILCAIQLRRRPSQIAPVVGGVPSTDLMFDAADLCSHPARHEPER